MTRNYCKEVGRMRCSIAQELLLAFGMYLPLLIIFVLAVMLWPTTSWPRDLGQWENNDPAITAWFRALQQPDNGYSCCGDADGYYADESHVEGDKVIAVVTDDRPDEPLGRVHVPIGTRFVVPPHKVVRKDGNPSGHVIIFLGAINWINGAAKPETRPVLCYVLNGGV